MARWKFQLSPNVSGVIGKGYRMDAVGQEIEDEVNDALPGYLKFHGVNKIVVKLGPSVKHEKDYYEMLGVGLKQWNEFDLQSYTNARESEKRQVLRDCVIQVFRWIQKNFDDTAFVDKAKDNLPWLAHALQRCDQPRPPCADSGPSD